jgi:hypothetical protein
MNLPKDPCDEGAQSQPVVLFPLGIQFFTCGSFELKVVALEEYTLFEQLVGILRQIQTAI